MNKIMNRKIRVYSDKFNNTGIKIKQGDVVTIIPDSEQRWKDNAIPSDSTGWDIPFLELFSCMRDIPSQRLMTMCGSIGTHKFGIGKKLSFISADEGELILFANDVWFLRWNNTGFIDVEVNIVREGE